MPTLEQAKARLYPLEAWDPFCHGTSSKFVPKILKEGLKPRECDETGVCRPSVYQNPKRFSPDTISLLDRVYIKVDQDIRRPEEEQGRDYPSACSMFARHAAKEFGGEPWVLEVKMSNEDEPFLVIDEDNEDFTVKKERKKRGDTTPVEVVDRWFHAGRCNDNLRVVRDILTDPDPERLKDFKAETDPCSILNHFSGIAETFPEKSKKFLCSWLQTNPPDADLRSFCDDAPEWWKSIVATKTFGYKGIIPPERLKVKWKGKPF